MLTDIEQARLQQEEVAWFEYTCDIYRTSSSEDDWGGFDETHGSTPLHAAVPCAVESGAAQEQERMLMGRIQGVQLFTLTLPAGTDIQLDDHVVIHTDRPDLHLQVQARMTPESFETAVRVIAAETGVSPH